MIKIDNLTFSYRRNSLLFNKLCLDLPSGNIYGLLGRNGAGKSTLLKIISGLLFPKGGLVSVEGFQPKDRDPRFLREIYLVNEEFILPEMDMEKYIQLYSPFYPRFNHKRMNDYLYEFNLPSKQKLSGFSYGQKKNFLLSFGLATDCNILILDEPTNGLDIPSKSQFRKIVANALHEERTFIVSTHQVRDMENLIDPIIMLDEGKIIFYRNHEEIASKLCISRQNDKPDDADTVYYETHFNGFTAVKRNTGETETGVSLELLFNAVLGNRDKINEIFKN